MFLGLVEAISLHRKGLLQGVEFFIFPADLDPWVFSTDLIDEAKNSQRTKVGSLENTISVNSH